MDPYLGQIELFAFEYAPRHWAKCEGQLLPIAQNQALFSLLGITFGGNGQTTFGLPDLRGRAAIGAGQGAGLQNYNLGEKGGSETHALTDGEMPNHQHQFYGANFPSSTYAPSPTAMLANTSGSSSTGNAFNVAIYTQPSSNAAMAANCLASAGQGQGHENRMPYVALTFCIALQGVLPER